MTIALIILQLLVMFCCFTYLYYNRKEEEEYLYAKIISFSLLGAIGFWIGFLPIPIGYCLQLLFLDAKFNLQIKKQAGLVGCLLFFCMYFYH